MNNKIKTLAEQSGIMFAPVVINDMEFGLENVYIDSSDVLEKFVELIIKKCVFIAETYDLLLDEDDRECCICRKVAWRIADNINSEFGIE